MKISIIIVHYKIKKILFNLLKSIEDSKPKLSYEIIVVDNDEKKSIEKDLAKEFPSVRYIKSNQNKGFGAGNNLGAKFAKGEILFFLNPDTRIFPGTLEKLWEFINRNKNAGAVAPLFIDENKKVYRLQGAEDLTILTGAIVLSFINKIFPNNPISKKFWELEWDKKSEKEVYVVPGTAFMIRKKLFEKIKGFDEKFFLYFEEFDLCRRIIKLGFKNYILPQAKVMHLWGKTTKGKKNIDKIYYKSRFYYFKKHFGFTKAFLLNIFLSINSKNLLIGLIVFLALFLRLFKLNELMVFIGDQGWFYLSARDLILDGQIPLVGITSSHTWIHQGPIWTYMLAIILAVSKFNPLSGAYFTAITGVLTVLLIYLVGANIFSKRIGIISSLLYASSPLIVLHSRMAYHTSLIPLFTILFIYLIYKWIFDGKIKIFPFIIAVLAVLYNLELATFILVLFFVAIFAYGLFLKKSWAISLFNKKTILLSSVFFILIMLPMILYDLKNGFPQTVKFLMWIFYKFLNPFFRFSKDFQQSFDYFPIFSFFSSFIQRLIFISNNIISFVIAFLGAFYVFAKTIKTKKTEYIILSSALFISVLGLLMSNTPSEAYLPILFPLIIISLGIFFERVFLFNKYLSIVILIIIVFFNSHFLIAHNYLSREKNGTGVSYTDRLTVSKYIIKESRGKEYNIIGKGSGSQFNSFTMNYEYLDWWLGKEPSKEKQNLKFIIFETPQSVEVRKVEK